MTAESVRQMRELEAERKNMQEQLYQRFIASTPMTVMDYEARSRAIDMKYAREEAFIILDAIMQNQ